MAWAAPGELDSPQVERYLRRMKLEPAQILSRKPDLALLGTLQHAHLLSIPFDTSLNHIDYAESSESRISLGGGPRISCELGKAFENMVTHRRGGYCFSVNVVYSALLRAMGFAAHDVVGRVFQNQNADPESVGWQQWAGLLCALEMKPRTEWQGVKGHRCILVDFPDGRYLTDVGFGSACPMRPIKLVDGQVVEGVNESESFRLTKQGIPGLEDRDPTEQWMLWRSFTPYGGHWSPVYHISVVSLPEPDFQVLNFWHAHSPLAPFTNLLLVTSTLANGDRQILTYGRDDEKAGKTTARWYIRSSETGKVIEEREVDMSKGAVHDLLRDKFGFA